MVKEKKMYSYYIGKFSCFPANKCSTLIYCVAHENSILCPETLQEINNIWTNMT